MNLTGSFHKPWDQIDASLQDGGIPGALGGFVGTDVGDNLTTKNMTAALVMKAVQLAGASISMHPYADMEGPPTRDLIDKLLRAIDMVAEKIHVSTRANGGSFAWSHATPSDDAFKLRPMRYPLRNPVAHQAVFVFLGLGSELAQMNDNAVHSNFSPQTGAHLLTLLMGIKEAIVVEQFGIEVRGHVSTEELANMFAGIETKFPAFIVPSADEPRPTTEAAASADEGVDLMRWSPKTEDWRRFDMRRATIFTGENVLQPEGTKVTTEDVAPEEGTDAA